MADVVALLEPIEQFDLPTSLVESADGRVGELTARIADPLGRRGPVTLSATGPRERAAPASRAPCRSHGAVPPGETRVACVAPRHTRRKPSSSYAWPNVDGGRVFSV
jgi:hypothetical protein